MSILVAGFLLCSAAGCADPTDPVPAPPDLTITTTGECARISFQITGASSVTTWYPSTACTVGLVVIRSAGASTWNGSTRTLTLKLRVANTSTEPVTLPVRLELPVEGKTVTLPKGVSPDSLVPLDMDSTLAADRKLWLVGGTGTLAPGDSSETRTLTFQVKEPVTKGRFWFVSSGEEVPADTARPVIPSPTQWPAPLLVTSTADPRYQYHRNVFGVAFEDTTSGVTIHNFLDAFNATVIGAATGTENLPAPIYYVLVPDPGTTWGAVDSLTAAMSVHSGVVAVGPVSFAAQPRIRSRFPADAQPRSAWVGTPSSALKPWLAIRAPLAWGCETGSYTGTGVRVGMVDNFLDTIPADLSASLTSARVALPSQRSAVPFDPQYPYTHATRVAGILTATGDNNVGIAGMAWRTELRVWTLGHVDFSTNHAEFARNQLDVLGQAVTDAAASGVKVLNFSVGLGSVTNQLDLYATLKYLKMFLDSRPDRLVVIAAGNDGATALLGLLATTLSLAGYPDTLFVSALDRSAAQLAGSPSYAGGVLFVSATDGTGAKWSGTNIWTGASTVAAPGVQITTLEGIQGLNAFDGTSYAAPFVSGLAALLWSMDGTLTGAQVKDYIRRGAQAPRFDPATGTMVTPHDIGEAGIYQIDAYSSLKLLAQERTGIPLCGNRVFVDSTNRIFAERQSGDELLYANSQNRIGLLRPYHGGRRLRLFDYAVGDQDLTWSGGSWSIGAPAPSPPEPPSGTWFSIDGLTHDGDSLAYPGGGFLGGGTHTVNVRLGTVTSLGRLLGSTTVTLAGPTTYTPTRQGLDSTGTWITTDSAPANPTESASTVTYTSPLSDYVLLVVNQWLATLDSTGSWMSCGAACQWRYPWYRVRSERAMVFRIPWINGGAVTQALWTVSDSSIGWLGIAEDGSEVVAGLARDDGVSIDGRPAVPPVACFLSYRDPATGAPRRAIRRAIQNPTACDGGATRGDGGISPIIARDASPGLEPQPGRNRTPGRRGILDFLRPTVRRSP